MSPAIPTAFDHDAPPDIVADFDRLPRLFIPGYDASHANAAVLMAEAIGESGLILAIGAGGGAELGQFARVCRSWRFTAVDPSVAMLEHTKARLASMDAGDRLTTLAGVSTDAPEGPFDSAIALLALHFVPDDGTRLTQLIAIRQRLRPAGSRIGDFRTPEGARNPSSMRVLRKQVRRPDSGHAATFLRRSICRLGWLVASVVCSKAGHAKRSCLIKA